MSREKEKARIGKNEGVSREKEKARIGKKRRRESGTNNTGKGKTVKQLTFCMLGYTPKLISAPGFACVMPSYLSQHVKVVLAYVRTRLPSLNCLFFASLAS